MDILLASTWRFDGLTRFTLRGGGPNLTEPDREIQPQYVWRQGRIEISAQREGDAWLVRSTSVGRLFGPREVLYEGTHKQVKHAAWNVMACVIRATRDEDEGVRAGREAARWMIGRRTADF
jgi:hypothetical protein